MLFAPISPGFGCIGEITDNERKPFPLPKASHDQKSQAEAPSLKSLAPLREILKSVNISYDTIGDV